MVILNKITERLLRAFALLKDDDRIVWDAQENDWYDDCDKFDGCYFIVKQMPAYPQHEMCRCDIRKIERPIPGVTAKATCDVRKFTEYVFSDKYIDGKKELFEGWGYDKTNSEYLRELYTTQAVQKYCNGEYEFLKVLNGFVAKIEIVLDIKTPIMGLIHIKTGWALLPHGEIKLTTPFSGYKI